MEKNLKLMEKLKRKNKLIKLMFRNRNLPVLVLGTKPLNRQIIRQDTVAGYRWPVAGATVI